MNQATAEGFQQMHRIVSDDLASMPLESLLNLNHIVPRRLGNLQTDDVSFKNGIFNSTKNFSWAKNCWTRMNFLTLTPKPPLLKP